MEEANSQKKEISSIPNKVPDIESDLISINWTKEKVCNFLKNNLEINDNIIRKVKKEEIDGEALILMILNKHELNTISLTKKNDISKISSKIEKSMLKINDDIKMNDLYKEIYLKDSYYLFVFELEFFLKLNLYIGFNFLTHKG